MEGEREDRVDSIDRETTDSEDQEKEETEIFRELVSGANSSLPSTRLDELVDTNELDPVDRRTTDLE